MKTLALLFAVLLALPAAAAQDFQGAAIAPAPQHPELYSFADVVPADARRRRHGELPGRRRRDPRRPPRSAQPAAEVQFSIHTVRRPEGWMLLLAGLAAAAWVARRRLAYGA